MVYINCQRELNYSNILRLHEKSLASYSSVPFNAKIVTSNLIDIVLKNILRIFTVMLLGTEFRFHLHVRQLSHIEYVVYL